MSAAPSLSIIIPCLNEADGIRAALDALAPLRRRGVEVLVVDGGSADDTLTRARESVDLVLCAPRGRAAQMNHGAERARGNVLLFLHADTRLPDGADTLIGSGLSASGRSWGRFDVTIAGRHPLLKVIAAAMNLRSRWTGIATGDQAIFVTRKAFEDAGGYPRIALMEDIALTVTLKRADAPLCLEARVITSGRRWEKHGVLRTVFLMWRLRLAYRLGADPEKLALHYAGHR
ncbi:MAG TPA: TIGR04283 family arsenosugar biosynthesis glycosyltransferase [Burkholderiales bacterium]|nr:TIGR04283 family arsenosugar biosynthesis glycosyltransferase [Burkholderiales bacterium]